MPLQQIEAGTVDIDERPFPVVVRINPRARRLTLRFDREGVVRVTCPSKRHVPDAVALARKRQGWLEARLRETPAGVPFAPGTVLPIFGRSLTIVSTGRSREAARVEGDRLAVGGARADEIARRVRRYIVDEASGHFSSAARKEAARLGAKVARVRVRDMRSRWGSCGQDGSLCFNWRLAFAPRRVAAYVVAHEVAHLRHMDHSPAFWAVVDQLDPHRAESAAWLKAHGAELQAYGRSLDAGSVDGAL
jgi:predicted metal-dependent hydrolase